MELELTGNGYLVDPSTWTDDVMYELARLDDNFELTDEHVKYIRSAREIFSETQAVPPIREFAKLHGMDRKAQPLYDLFPRGPMKMITKYGGMPQPTGCV
jgi:tRNA 2-thiouridine synthesizing protein E